MLKGEGNNIDYIVTMAPVKGSNLLGKQSILEVGKMGKSTDVGNVN